jgi:hypothetical protein
MELKTQKTVEYTLTLTAKEAFILKGLVQNPPCDDKDIMNFCETIFLALPTFDELGYFIIREDNE